MAPASALASAGLAASGGPAIDAGFEDPALFDRLDQASLADLDTLTFGVVAMALDGVVEAYNSFEAKLAGLTPGRVIGRNFFKAVAPCTNNYMIAQRFETEADIDTIIDYVFTLRMAPKKVRLRMLKRSGHRRMFLVVERRV